MTNDPSRAIAIEFRSTLVSTVTTRSSGPRIFGILTTLLCLAPFMMGEAHGTDCGASYRISHSNASCLDAWYENKPFAVHWVAQNKCPDYGDVTVFVDLENALDRTHGLTDGSRWEWRLGSSLLNTISVDDMACCIDLSDLCKKSQVEVDSNDKIDHYNPSDNTWTNVLVGTHQERYEYCENNSTSIYCTNNPNGDAFDAPLLCRSEQCTV